MVIQNNLNKTIFVGKTTFVTLYEQRDFKVLFTEQKNLEDIQALKTYFKDSNRFNSNFDFICVEIEGVGYEIEINF